MFDIFLYELQLSQFFPAMSIIFWSKIYAAFFKLLTYFFSEEPHDTVFQYSICNHAAENSNDIYTNELVLFQAEIQNSIKTGLLGVLDFVVDSYVVTCAKGNDSRKGSMNVKRKY